MFPEEDDDNDADVVEERLASLKLTLITVIHSRSAGSINRANTREAKDLTSSSCGSVSIVSCFSRFPRRFFFLFWWLLLVVSAAACWSFSDSNKGCCANNHREGEKAFFLDDSLFVLLGDDALDGVLW